MKLYDELKARGLIAQVTNEEEISEMMLPLHCKPLSAMYQNNLF